MLLFGLGLGAGQQLRLAAADLFPPSRRGEGLGYVLTGALIGALGGPLLVNLAVPGFRFDSPTLVWLLVSAVLVASLALVFSSAGQIRRRSQTICALTIPHCSTS